MLKQLLVYAFLLVVFNATAQSNLVPNPSFEEYSECPDDQGQIALCDSWFEASTTPAVWGADYYNTCNNSFLNPNSNSWGHQSPLLGNGYLGIGVYSESNPKNAEYIQTKLTSPLIKGKTYSVSFYVSLAEKSRFALINWGVLFTQDSIKRDAGFNPFTDFTPQILNKNDSVQSKTDWIKIKGEYVAFGQEKFLTIGNFNLQPNNDTIDLGSGSTVSYAYYYIENVSVICIDTTGCEEQLINEVTLYPNPTNGVAYVKYNLQTGVEQAVLAVFDNLGRIVYITKLNASYGYAEIPAYNFSSGLYFVRINENNNKLWAGKLIVE